MSDLTMTVVLCWTVLIMSVSVSAGQNNPEFLKTTPTKFFEVRYVASRYPAAASKYRKSIDNGQVLSTKTYSILKVDQFSTLWITG